MRTLFFFLLSWLIVSSAYGSDAENRIRVGFSGYPVSNLYYVGYDDYSEAITSLVLEPLVRLNPETLFPETGLSERFSENQDHTRFEFELNSKATFSDSSPVTAEDILFTWTILNSPPPQLQAYASQFSSITDCKIIKNKIVFSAKQAVPMGIALFANFYILSKKHFANGNITKDFNETFVGSGPYVFDRVKWGRSIFLKKNPNYWGRSHPSNQGKYGFERIEFHAQTDPTLLFQMLLKHEIDYLYFLSAKSWALDTQNPLFQKGAILKLETKNQLSFGMAGIAWNMRKPLFQDKRVRKALGLLFDRNRLIHDFFYDQYQPSTGIAYYKSKYHHPDNTPLAFDPAQAKLLLTEAGWSLNSKNKLQRQNQVFSFEILTGNPPAAKFLTLYQEDLRKVGIDASIRVVDWGTYLRLRSQGQYDALDFSRNRDEFMTDLDMTWNSQGAVNPISGNVTGFSNASADTLLARLRITASPEERVSLVQKLDKLIADEFPLAFSWEPRFQRIAFWNQYTFNGVGYHRYSKWNTLFHEWKSKQSNRH